MLSWRFESELGCKWIEELIRHLLPDAPGVGMLRALGGLARAQATRSTDLAAPQRITRLGGQTEPVHCAGIFRALSPADSAGLLDPADRRPRDEARPGVRIRPRNAPKYRHGRCSRGGGDQCGSTSGRREHERICIEDSPGIRSGGDELANLRPMLSHSGVTAHEHPRLSGELHAVCDATATTSCGSALTGSSRNRRTHDR